MNLELLRNKLATLGKKGGNDALFKPTEGDTVIRIVPLKGNADDPFQVLHFHYLGNKTILSPRTYGERDPIGDFSDSLVAEGNLSKEDYKAAKKFSPVARTFVPIIVRGKESEGVKFWAFGKQIYEQLLTTIADEDYGDISDITKGHDIKITFTPKEKSSTGFADTQMMVRPKSSKLSDDAEIVKKLLEEQPVLMDQYKKWTHVEMTEFLNNFLNPPTTPATGPQPTANDDWATETPKTASPSTPAASVTPDVQADFDKIFNS